VKCDVATICVGLAASMGAVLLAAGTPGKRSALPNAEIMLHQVMGGAEGQAAEVEITARQILKMRDKLNKLLARHTGKSINVIAKDTDRDYYLSADEAKTYGLIDKIVSRSVKKD